LDEFVIGEIGAEFNDTVVVVLLGWEAFLGDFAQIEHNIMVVSTVEK
jgi:hypothetical protein